MSGLYTGRSGRLAYQRIVSKTGRYAAVHTEVAGEMESLLLRADEVSRLTNLGRSKVYELMASGDLPVVRIGRAVRVPRAGLDAWIRRQTMHAVNNSEAPPTEAQR